MTAPARPKREKKKPNHERWVISYADLLTLLLALFVVLYASSTRNKQKMAEEAESFVEAFHGTPHAVVQTQTAGQGIMPHQVSPRPQPDPSPHTPHTSALSRQVELRLEAEILALDKLHEKLQFLLQPLTAKRQVVITQQPLTLTIQLNASVLFPNGKAELMPAAQLLLAQVAGSLSQLPPAFTVVVQGYTDNQPIKTAQFPSNWSLSVERSVSVVQLLATKGVSSNQLAAEGFGQFSPIASNATDAGRAQNRRVILVIHAPDPNAS
jgi:chemotaxis protein MotB